MSMYEQGKQVCSVQIAVFANHDDLEKLEGQDAALKAFNFMKQLAQLYAKGGIDNDCLYQERDDRLEQQGLKAKLPPHIMKAIVKHEKKRKSSLQTS